MGTHYHGLLENEKANSEIKRKPNNQHVTAFLSGAKRQLLRTKRPVYLYCQFQLEKLKAEFGDRLIYEYDEVNQWWKCYLKKEGK